MNIDFNYHATETSNMASIIGSYGAMIEILLISGENRNLDQSSVRHARRVLETGEFVWKHRHDAAWSLSRLREYVESGVNLEDSYEDILKKEKAMLATGLENPVWNVPSSAETLARDNQSLEK